jgi:hypothetical protein
MRDQALLFDTPGGLIQRGVASVFQHHLYCAANIGLRKFGFGAPKKKLGGSPMPHLRDRDNMGTPYFRIEFVPIWGLPDLTISLESVL